MNPVPPYAGLDQPSRIIVPKTTSYRQEREEGPWALPPYSAIYPPDSQDQGSAAVPPPVYKTDLWAAMQTWPL